MTTASFSPQILWKGLASLKLTLVCLALLMALVLLCTLAQVDMGTLGAVKVYMRSFVVLWQPAGFSLQIPIFPGGALVGLVLLLNLAAGTLQRLAFTPAKAGLWLIHAGLILLVGGEFVTGAFQVEHRMTIDEGQTVNYLEHYHDQELAVIDTTEANFDQVHAIPESLLEKGGTLPLHGTPLSLKIHAFYPNAILSQRRPTDPPALATVGVGASLRIEPRERTASDTEMNLTSALVEPLAGGKSYGTWLTSVALGAPQSFTHEGRTYQLVMRPQRTYLPYSLTLKKFSFDRYAGTQIPKNFSSLVDLNTGGAAGSREVLIFMNQPLRFDGKAFYQASFNKEETQTILQVVQNPGWLLPYISCTLVSLGLLVHFGLLLWRSRMGDRASGKEA